jgi:hypothetical protein
MLLTAVIAVSLVIAGCGSTPAAEKREPTTNSTLPSFLLNPPNAEGVIYGVGTSTNSNQGMALTQSKTRASVDLANKISQQVKNMVTDYQRAAGIGDDNAVLGFTESITQTLTSTTLTGVEDVKTEITSDGAMWVLVRMSKADAAKQATDAINQVLSEESQYAEFKALNSLEAMNAELDKADPKALAPTAPAAN